MENLTEKQRCKGVDVSFAKQNMNHNKFKEGLYQVLLAIREEKASIPIPSGSFYRIESDKHQLKTVKKSKLTLCYFNDKKYFYSPNKAHSFGHKNI